MKTNSRSKNTTKSGHLFFYPNKKTFNHIFICGLIFLLFQFNSCAELEPDNPIKIEIDKNNRAINYSEFVDSISYLPLEFSEESMIGRVSDLCYINGTYFVFDNISKSILFFNEKGGYINKISHVGNGPGEYTYIGAFSINGADSSINILERRRILKYSMSGRFISSIKIDDVVRDFVCLNDGKYILFTPDFMEQNRRGAWLVDSDGNFEAQLLAVDEDFKFTPMISQYLCIIDENTIGIPGIDNNYIYHYSEDKLGMAYNFVLDQGDIKNILKKETQSFAESSSRPNIFIKTSYRESQEWVITTFVSFKDNSVALFLYSKNDSKYILGNNFINDIDMIMGTPTRAVSGNSIICVVNPENPDKNPVLQILHLK